MVWWQSTSKSPFTKSFRSKKPCLAKEFNIKVEQVEKTVELIDEGKADVKVLDNTDKWYGVTYKEDKIAVTEAFKQLKADGVYPEKF